MLIGAKLSRMQMCMIFRQQPTKKIIFKYHGASYYELLGQIKAYLYKVHYSNAKPLPHFPIIQRPFKHRPPIFGSSIHSFFCKNIAIRTFSLKFS